MTSIAMPQAEPTTTKPSLGWLVSFLLFVAVASNIYLTVLHWRITHSEKQTVESFCSVNQKMNCVAVASSEYASFAGIPVAIYALEFYALSWLLVTFAYLGVWNFKPWCSLAFWTMVIAFPFSLLMAWISVFKIGSVCLVCSAIYVVNTIVLLATLSYQRQNLRGLLTDGPRALLSAMSTKQGKLITSAIAIFFIAQFFWMPRVLGEKIVDPTNVDAAALIKKWNKYPNKGYLAGPTSAPLQIEVFSDFQCPFCSKAHEGIEALLDEFKGKIAVTFRHFPNDNGCNRTLQAPFHQYACNAAFLSHCALKQNRFWPFADLLFSRQPNLDVVSITGYAKDLGLDTEQLLSCAEQADTKQVILDDVEMAIAKKVRGTPTFFLGGQRIEGFDSVEAWRKRIKDLLAK